MIGVWIVIGVSCGYVVSSAVLLRFPGILHRKKRHAFTSKHISHRGGAGENLENTMDAFRNALKNGTDMLEIDVQLTADGQVVVSHDDQLERLTGQSISVSETNYEDLPSLRSTLEVTFTNRNFCTCSTGDRKIPLLRSVFEEFPHVPVNIDIKQENEKLIDKVLELINEFQRKHLVVIGNIKSAIVDAVHRKDPEVPLCFSLNRCLFLVVTFYLGLLPYLPIKEGFLEIPLPRTILRYHDMQPKYRTLFKVLEWVLVSPVLFRHLQRRGIQVYLWVVNDEEDMRYCFEDLGVTGVMTDYPRKLSAFLGKVAI